MVDDIVFAPKKAKSQIRHKLYDSGKNDDNIPETFDKATYGASVPKTDAKSRG